MTIHVVKWFFLTILMAKDGLACQSASQELLHCTNTASASLPNTFDFICYLLNEKRGESCVEIEIFQGVSQDLPKSPQNVT